MKKQYVKLFEEWSESQTNDMRVNETFDKDGNFRYGGDLDVDDITQYATVSEFSEEFEDEIRSWGSPGWNEKTAVGYEFQIGTDIDDDGEPIQIVDNGAFVFNSTGIDVSMYDYYLDFKTDTIYDLNNKIK